MKIMIGVDDSPCSQAALDFVRKLPWPAETAVTIVSSVELPSSAYLAAYVPANIQFNEWLDELTKFHNEVVARDERGLRQAGMKVESRVLQGDARETLVEEATGQSWQANREISYYSGWDDDESWSEGSHADEVVFASIPPGRYHLTVDGEAAPELSRTVAARMKVDRGGARWSNFFLLTGLLLLFPIWTRVRVQAFETQRWLESDHPPSSSSS